MVMASDSAQVRSHAKCHEMNKMGEAEDVTNRFPAIVLHIVQITIMINRKSLHIYNNKNYF